MGSNHHSEGSSCYSEEWQPLQPECIYVYIGLNWWCTNHLQIHVHCHRLYSLWHYKYTWLNTRDVSPGARDIRSDHRWHATILSRLFSEVVPEMKLLCAILLCSYFVIVTHAVMFKDCGKTLCLRVSAVWVSRTGSKNCKVNSVDVEGCAATAQSCDLERGTTVNMTLNFTASEFWAADSRCLHIFFFQM